MCVCVWGGGGSWREVVERAGGGGGGSCPEVVGRRMGFGGL